MDCYRFYHLLLVATMLLVLVAISIVDAQDYPPRFLEVDPKDSEIIENGKFAIDAHNVKENENLEYRILVFKLMGDNNNSSNMKDNNSSNE
ncbi:OLC1v1016063C1 [Oldenlandia corymbosa var. corymbosa]|uniref:OLC1v1016063C1 n=1 Tax=Oldenlandia corymbosa var. corymbosa TaxID=529605 RepID=A0AAV1E5M1_OLDCO|nr:OLC1v1016063C1 [Oldenlandia corymbosa var. corymbosa]